MWAWHDGGFAPEEWLPGGLLLLALGLRDLDPALLELAEDGVRLERVQMQRLEHLDQLGIAKRPVLLRLFEQVVQLGSRQHVLDFDRGHPCNLASFLPRSAPAETLSLRDIRRNAR